jgi:acetyl esterase
MTIDTKGESASVLSARLPITAHFERALLRRLVALPEPLLRRIVGPRIVSPDGKVLDMEAQLLLRAAEIAGRREPAELGVQGARAEMEHSVAIVDFRPIAARVEDRTIPGPRREVPIRIYHPRSRFAPRSVLVYFHGGGFVVGSIAGYDGVCRVLARDAEAIVVSVGYGLAPEERFPAGVEDGVAATRWVIAHAASFGGDPNGVAVGGDSAGGNIAAVVAQELRKDAVGPMFQLLVYPATDMTRSLPSHRLFGEGYLLTQRSMDFYLGNYVTEAEKRDPRASPLFASRAFAGATSFPVPGLEGLPPALVLTAGFDPLRDEGRAYADAMRAAGVDVTYLCVEGSVHGFFSFGGVFVHARRAVEEAARALRNAFDHAKREDR